MDLSVYNTLTRRKEAFEPLDPNRVGIYVCGPTVYGHSHVGHAKSYISFDVIVRWLRQLYGNVCYVQNITDVGHLTDDADDGEDKVIAEARRRGLHPMAVAEEYTNSYLADMDALGVQRPDIMPRASGHIPEQIELCRKLIELGHAYETDGSVYFAVSSRPDYGKLSGRVVDEVQAGARVAVREEKRDPHDFGLWKRAEPGHIMRWPSPWGEGFPGWHLECSAMAMKYLGETIDIHGGGLENQFPHHECEIAQSESVTGAPFVRYWLHNHMVTVNGEKMGKSKGNFILIKDLIDPAWDVHPLVGAKYHPRVLRYYIINSHYRSDVDFTVEGMRAAEAGLKRLQNTAANLARAIDNTGEGEPAGIDLEQYEQQFADAMNDDFNTPQALAVLFDLAREINRVVDGGRAANGELQAAADLFTRLGCDVLGLVPTAARGGGVVIGAVSIHGGGHLRVAGREVAGTPGAVVDKVMQMLIDLRAEARKERNFALADQIRDRLAEAGVVLEDRPEGTTYRVEGS